ncbi:PREDICTED: uncharacterized protein LOC107117612 [Gekko japonicus]|uniref:Uncharacterized protein LOC107117612 n=1 Tax=Gekko japonicus TaxID=146911 RepID=A0ABM1KNF8_GEKJA|nr:PREDICTED: uncharacterized protein LOC107117612 [Gekko japonicus]
MAMVLPALARFFHSDLTAVSHEPAFQGLAPWYLLLTMRLVAHFIAMGPWSSVGPDLTCNWTSVEADARPFCSALCFNQHFSAPITSAWGFSFLMALIPMGLMRLIVTRPKHQRKEADVKLANPTCVSHNLPANFNTAEHPSPALEASFPSITATRADGAPVETPKMPSHSPWRSVTYSLCVVLLLMMELAFLWVLIAWQVPAVSKTTFLCLPGAQICPKALECAVAGQIDKQTALWMLAVTALINMAACLLYLFLKLQNFFVGHRR